MIVQFEIDEATAKQLAMVMWSAEHPKRAVRTDPKAWQNRCYAKINELGEDMAERLGLNPELGEEQPGL